MLGTLVMTVRVVQGWGGRFLAAAKTSETSVSRTVGSSKYQTPFLTPRIEKVTAA